MEFVKTKRSYNKAPRIVTVPKYRAKAEVALNETRGILAELIHFAQQSGWTFTNYELSFTIQSPEDFIIFCARRSRVIQCYYLGGGLYTVEKYMEDFETLHDLLLWIHDCQEKLKDKPRESPEMDRMPEPAKTSIGVSLRGDKYRVVGETPDGLKIIGRYDTFLEAAAAYQNHLELSQGLDE
jgi:hypothetical protein